MRVNKKGSSEEVSDEGLHELVSVADELGDPISVLETGEEADEESNELADFEGVDVDEVPQEPEVAEAELS